MASLCRNTLRWTDISRCPLHVNPAWWTPSDILIHTLALYPAFCFVSSSEAVRSHLCFCTLSSPHPYQPLCRSVQNLSKSSFSATCHICALFVVVEHLRHLRQKCRDSNCLKILLLVNYEESRLLFMSQCFSIVLYTFIDFFFQVEAYLYAVWSRNEGAIV